MSEFDVRGQGVAISVRLAWLPGPNGRGALRANDRVIWHGALWCRRCQALGYDHADIDVVLEAQRLGVDHAPRVAACPVCGTLACDACRCCA